MSWNLPINGEKFLGPTAPQRAVDLYGIPITQQPVSLLSGLFTYGIPDFIWRTGTLNGGNGTATTEDGALKINSGTVDGGITYIQSRSHPRYEPDRQLRTVMATNGLPIGTDVIFRFGQFNDYHGYFIEIDCFDGSATIKTRNTTGIVAPVVVTHDSGIASATIADTTQATLALPAGTDLSNATLLDINAQWRGVGNLSCLVNLQEAAMTNRPSIASDIWTGNPGLPLRIELERKTSGSDETIYIGCAETATLGGIGPKYKPLPLSVTATGIDNTERPILIVQAAGFLKGVPCTRDHLFTRIIYATADSAGTFRVRRNPTITDTAITWSVPDTSRGLVLGAGTVSDTVSGGQLLYSHFISASDAITSIDPSGGLGGFQLRPIAGTLTTGSNRGDPNYGETIVISFEKSSGGTANVTTIAGTGSEY